MASNRLRRQHFSGKAEILDDPDVGCDVPLKHSFLILGGSVHDTESKITH